MKELSDIADLNETTSLISHVFNITLTIVSKYYAAFVHKSMNRFPISLFSTKELPQDRMSFI